VTVEPDIGPIGLDEDDRERIVRAVVQRVRGMERDRGSLLGDVVAWARPALTLAAAASLAGLLVAGSGGDRGVLPPDTPSTAAGFETWVQNGARPSTVEVLARLTRMADEPTK
jgi:hypothetical protein